MLKITVAAVLALTVFAGPARAEPPGTDVCVSGGTGNPCNGNNGNGKGVGNVGKRAVPVSVPDAYGKGAVVVQRGTGNTALVRQSSPNDQFVSIEQIGDANRAEVNQPGASAYAAVLQEGVGNGLTAAQRGSGHNTLFADQRGDGNAIRAQQYAASQTNAADLSQTGAFNEMRLLQDGGSNDALLTQTGNGNRMTLAQYGQGNQASWKQDGSYIRDLRITQFGSSTVNISQQNGRQ